MMIHATQPRSLRSSDRLLQSLVLALIAALAIAALLSGCLAEDGNKSNTGSGGSGPTWTELTSAGGAITSNCQACHGATPIGSGNTLSLTTSNYATVIGMTNVAGSSFNMVVSGNAADSFLYMATQGDSRVTGVSPWPMSGGTAAGPDIKDWIDGGAAQ